MMVKPPQFLILIYGSSPRLQRAERSLRAATDLRVIQIEPDDDHAMQQLAVVQEGMLLYDVGAVNPQVIQAIHTLHPAMATLGLGGADGAYALQAALAACHARANRVEDTDWAGIAALYARYHFTRG